MKTTSICQRSQVLRLISVLLAIFAIAGNAFSEVAVQHYFRAIGNTFYEHFYNVRQITGPGKVRAVEFKSPFSNGSSLKLSPYTLDPVLVAPSGWTASIKTDEEDETVVLRFEALSGIPGIASGESALFKVISTNSNFWIELNFECYATQMRSNWSGTTIPSTAALPDKDMVLFSQMFNYEKLQYAPNISSKPEAWGLSGSKWSIPKADEQFPGVPTVSTEITTVTNETGSLPLSSNLFVQPIAFTKGQTGFELQFRLKFMDSWDQNQNGVEDPGEVANWVAANDLGVCFLNSSTSVNAWCLHLTPNTGSNSNPNNINLTQGSNHYTGTSSLLGDGVIPDGGQRGEWAAVRVEFKPSGELRVFVGPVFDDMMANVLTINQAGSLPDFTFDRFVFKYSTRSQPEDANSVSLDDIILIRTELEPVVTGLYLGQTIAETAPFAIVGGIYTIVLSDPIPSNANIEIYVGTVKATILSKSGKSVTFRFPNVVGANSALSVKINGVSMAVPITVKSIPNLTPILGILLK
jgi:hypothetical protein